MREYAGEPKREPVELSGDAKTAPDAYGILQVVCRACGNANAVSLGFQEREVAYVKCDSCGERRILVASVEDR